MSRYAEQYFTDLTFTSTSGAAATTLAFGFQATHLWLVNDTTATQGTNIYFALTGNAATTADARLATLQTFGPTPIPTSAGISFTATATATSTSTTASAYHVRVLALGGDVA